MKYINKIPVGEKVLVKHKNLPQKVEGIISYDGTKKFLFHNNEIHGGHRLDFGYTKSYMFDDLSDGTFTEGIISIELFEYEYEIF